MSQQYPPQPPPAYPPQGGYQTPQENPGKGLAIGGLICGIILGPLAFIGLIMSIVALRKSKAAGMTNGVAVAGIVVSILVFITAAIFTAAMVIGLMWLMGQCAELGPGVHMINGAQVTCT